MARSAGTTELRWARVSTPRSVALPSICSSSMAHPRSRPGWDRPRSGAACPVGSIGAGGHRRARRHRATRRAGGAAAVGARVRRRVHAPRERRCRDRPPALTRRRGRRRRARRSPFSNGSRRTLLVCAGDRTLRSSESRHRPSIHAGRAAPSFGSVLHINEKGGSFGGTEEYIAAHGGVVRSWRAVARGLWGRRWRDAVRTRLDPHRRWIGVTSATGDDARRGRGRRRRGAPDVSYLHNVFDPAVVEAVVERSARARCSGTSTTTTRLALPSCGGAATSAPAPIHLAPAASQRSMRDVAYGATAARFSTRRCSTSARRWPTRSAPLTRSSW